MVGVDRFVFASVDRWTSSSVGRVLNCGYVCDNPPFGIKMVETDDWSNINLVVESWAIKIDREIAKNEVVKELIVIEL